MPYSDSLTMSLPRVAALAGVKATLPLLLGLIPFGLIYGVSAAQVGLSMSETGGLSVVVFAGASQLAILQLFADEAAVPVLIATGLVINLRLAMYSASIAPYLRHLPVPKRLGLAYLLTDQAYALAIHRYTEQPTDHRAAFFLGAAIPFWVTWQTCSLLGFRLGTSVPPHWHLDFAIPLTFIALLIPTLKSRSSVLTALVSGSVVLGATVLPYNLGLIVAAVVGIAAGLLLEQWRSSSHAPA